MEFNSKKRKLFKLRGKSTTGTIHTITVFEEMRIAELKNIIKNSILKIYHPQFLIILKQGKSLANNLKLKEAGLTKDSLFHFFAHFNYDLPNLDSFYSEIKLIKAIQGKKELHLLPCKKKKKYIYFFFFLFLLFLFFFLF